MYNGLNHKSIEKQVGYEGERGNFPLPHPPSTNSTLCRLGGAGRWQRGICKAASAPPQGAQRHMAPKPVTAAWLRLVTSLIRDFATALLQASPNPDGAWRVFPCLLQASHSTCQRPLGHRGVLPSCQHTGRLLSCPAKPRRDPPIPGL